MAHASGNPKRRFFNPPNFQKQAGLEGSQQELFPLTTLSESLGAETLESAGMVLASDNNWYHIKDDKNGFPARASEFLCGGILRELGVLCPQYRIIQMQSGDLLFGSKKVSGIAEATETAAMLRSAPDYPTQFPGLCSFLSSLFAFDRFMHNVDRHSGNFLAHSSVAGLMFLPIDHSQSAFSFWPFANFEGGSNTLTFARIHFKNHGFDLATALAMVDRIAAIPSEKIIALLAGMPSEWIADNVRSAFISWWGGPEFFARLDKLRKGLADGSLL